jgi:DNA-binding CsgD family transcriptional regulator
MSISYRERMSATDPRPPRAPVGERRPATEREAKVLASTLRMRILRVCLHEAHSNKEIAQILDRDPASTLHHVRRLVDTGFLAAQPVRRGTRGSREIPYLATGKSWNVSTPGGDQALLDTFLEEVALVPSDEIDSARLGLKLSPADMEEFRDRLRTLLDDFAERPDDPSGRPWSVFLSIHPDPNQP